ncbi:MAG: hypothetical protein A2293_11650 [Elusimicrobia bacterium RIFOXYB2_FULL_49_7]|nr:MAG: hypothetical protein A2293_11650 [Elusimicrobia bacterium RIFOXYB2_FULL_49_7]
MSKPVSVVVPTFNRLEPLKCCLESLNAQTLSKERFDWFVVDDGSTDGTSDYLRANGHPFLSQSRMGPARARNVGAQHTNSDILVFIDDDAVAEPEWLETLWAAYQQGIWTDAAEGPVSVLGERQPLAHWIDHPGAGGFLTCNLAVSRQWFDRLGGFDETFPFPVNEDYDFFLRLKAKNGKTVFLPDMHVRHPVCRLPFFASLRNSGRYAFSRVQADRLLEKRHPCGFASVKAVPTAAQSEKRLAWGYLFFFFNRAGWKANLLHPFRALGWGLVCLMRQIAFFRTWLTGRHS